LWLSKFAPSLALMDLSRLSAVFAWSRPASWLLLAGLSAIALACRLLGRDRRNLVVAVAAFGGMTLETLLLVHYQLKHGVVFQNLGLLLMSVMAGLATGAWIVDRYGLSLAAHGVQRRRHTAPRTLLAAFVVLALGAAAAISTGRASGLIPVSLMLFGAGCLVAAVFSHASLDGDDPRRLVSPLYAADVLGGAAGSIVCSLLLIPLVGLPPTAEWTAALMAVAMILA
jgi:hypothetical protein